MEDQEPKKCIHDNPEAMNKMEEPWYNWRSLAGFIYLFICIMDFVIMPVYVQVEYSHTKKQVSELIQDIQTDDKKGVADQEFAIKIIDKIKVEQWSPVTLVGGGLFHMAFGAILTGAAVTKGFERREAVKSGKY